MYYELMTEEIENYVDSWFEIPSTFNPTILNAMYVITIIGGAKQGKTPFVKDYIKSSNCLVFDVNNEYGQRTKYPNQKPYNLPVDNNLKRSRFIEINVNKFKEVCKLKKNTVCVFEEATMFFQGATDEDTRSLIFGKAHSGNVYLLLFHSINSVPPRIMEGSDFVVLFKTNDEVKTIERKFPRLLEPYHKLRSAKDGTHIKVKML